MGINSDVSKLYKIGVEKIIVNSLIQEDPGIIKKVIENYGSQAIVGCLDFRKPMFGEKSPTSYIGHKIKLSILNYANYLVKEIGVGELMLQSMDNDGTWKGYDYEITNAIEKEIDVPIIACGGCGKIDDLKKVLYECNAQAAAIGSMAVYSKQGMGVLINFPNREAVIIE